MLTSFGDTKRKKFGGHRPPCLGAFRSSQLQGKSKQSEQSLNISGPMDNVDDEKAFF
jgi:hypothetical protein